MAAGRHGAYRDDELRDRDSDLEITARKDYYQERFREGDGERVRRDLKDRVRVREKEALNGSYRSPLSSNSFVAGKASNRLSRRSADREPGELSSGSGSDDPDVPPYRGTVNGVEKPEDGDVSAVRKRKFSPIIWNRDDDRRSSTGNSRSRSDLVHPVSLPPPPPLLRGHMLSRPVEVVRQLPDQALQLSVEVFVDSPQDQNDEINVLRPGQWADRNNAMEDDEAKVFGEEFVRKKKKSTPLTVSGEQYQLLKKLQSPEIGEVRECSEGADSQSYNSSSGRSGDDEQNIGSQSNDSMDIDVEEVKDDASVHILDSDHENFSGEAKTPEPMQPPQRSINMLQGCRSVDEFERLNKIDEGTYGVVYRARDKMTGEIVALKKVKMEKEREGFPLTSLREINILLSFHHPSIVDVKEVVVGSSLDSIFMVMEYMEHDLKGLMETMKQPFSQSEVKCLMLQLLSGVKYLHDNWVLHRDLKTSNLLLNNRGELKICDFGLARQYGSPLKPYTHLVVTLWYRAPELLLGTKQYSTAIDMWSLGCIMAEFLAKEPLFNGKTEFDQLDKIFRTLGTPNEKIWPGFAKLPGVKVNFVRQPYNRLREKFPPTSFSGRPTLSEAGFDLLNKLLTYDPEKRITAEDALNHDWFREVPLPKEKDFMPTFPAQHAQDRRLRRIMKSPDPLEEQRRKELQQGEQVSTGLFG
ncbi:Cyclin-dependent kinase G-2 [Dendrobium catenatum]|uniref:Cyclin-dependent kinase G-2 n=1 Tax=Dendrobium catenatum TaxID=906689 RepID=A0A2I0WKM6_9ASPA|nr:Cyclin-dependent kinase G-2 [Dendrobium catenatum]